jgi:tRNA/tmRNA/rRNA uracil-C5-methylase (TrmA/RlmC/RlmD family)
VLARDLKHLCRIYELESIAFVDLFPQTGHLELVAQLRLHDQATAS